MAMYATSAWLMLQHLTWQIADMATFDVAAHFKSCPILAQ
jgi:hypothetical protein